MVKENYPNGQKIPGHAVGGEKKARDGAGREGVWRFYWIFLKLSVACLMCFSVLYMMNRNDRRAAQEQRQDITNSPQVTKRRPVGR